MMSSTLMWKPDWAQAKERLTRWWERNGLAVYLSVPRKTARDGIAKPLPQADHRLRLTDPGCRVPAEEYKLAKIDFCMEAFPYFQSQIGPGSLGSFLGAQPGFAETTVWYNPCIGDPDHFGPIRFDPQGRWFKIHMDLIEAALASSKGRYLVAVPDLIEGLDTLAAMRGTEQLLADLVDRPAWVHQRLEEINQAYFEAFERIYQAVKDPQGGNVYTAFHIWGPGRTLKVQCDFCCMISPPMFREFVQPYLRAQCDRMDYSLYHLDGPGAVRHLDALLEIESLDAIQWMPGAGVPMGGDPCWYDLCKRILAGGKSLQIFHGKVDEIRPLLDAIGPKGVFLRTSVGNRARAERLTDELEQYR